MSALKKFLLGFAGVAVVLALVFMTARRQIGEALFTRVAGAQVGRDNTLTLGDGLHVAICGAGSPMPDPTRAGPCVAVLAGDYYLIVDAGAGSSRNLQRMGLPPGKIDAILLTHFHSDHIDGLGEMMLNRWVGATHTEPVPVIGPEGVEQVVAGFNQAYALDSRYRLDHHGDTIAPLSGAGGRARTYALPPAAEGNEVIVLDEGDLKVTAFRVDHAPIAPAVGYRFEYKGRTAVISGDTAAADSLVQASRGADLLLHEALDPDLVGILNGIGRSKGLRIVEAITHDILDYHASPEQAAEAARDAGVGMLVLYHIVPPLPLPVLYPAFLGDAPSIFDGPILVGEDGDLISLPAGSDAIETADLP